MNPKAIGEISEAVVLAKLLRDGAVVLMPFGNNQRYDFVIDRRDGTFERVQVKTGRIRDGCVVFKTASVNGFTGARRTYMGDVDCFMVYCPDNDCVYRVPIEQCPSSMMSLRLGVAASRSTTRLASSFLA